MILVAFVLFSLLVLAWLITPGDAKNSFKVPAPNPALEPIASPAD